MVAQEKRVGEKNVRFRLLAETPWLMFQRMVNCGEVVEIEGVEIKLEK